MYRRLMMRCRLRLVLVLTTGCICMALLLNAADVIGESEQLTNEKKNSVKFLPDPRMDLFHTRRTTMLNVCHNNEKLFVGYNRDNVLKEHFVVDRKHKFVYCAMEKVGSTFWRRLLQIVSGSSKAKSPFDISPEEVLLGYDETFRKLSFDEIHVILTSYKKFIITRDPYSRLFSGYMDKVFSANLLFWDIIGKPAIKKFRPMPSEKSLRCGHDLSFTEFVKYFIYTETSNVNRDGHFVPMFDHCRPCQVKYDIIARIETLDEDTLSVLKMLNMTTLHDTLAEQFLEDTREDSFKDQTGHLFNSFNRTKDCLPVFDNLKRNWLKFQTRGLISKHVEFPFSSTESARLKPEMFIRELKRAVQETEEKKVSQSYRKDFLFDAYSEVPKEDLRRLHAILNKDCELFGYDCKTYPWVENAFIQ